MAFEFVNKKQRSLKVAGLKPGFLLSELGLVLLTTAMKKSGGALQKLNEKILEWKK